MKNYQKTTGRSCVLSLKISFLFLCCIFYTSNYAQTDKTGFSAENERQKAINQGVHAEEIEGYIQSRKRYLKAQYDFKTNGIGKRNTTPPKSISFTRKSGLGCVGDFENGTVTPWTGWTGYSNGISDIVNNLTVYTLGTVSGRHSIMSSGNDPNDTNIPMVHSGSHSLRLGNSSVGAQTERVSRSVTVTEKCFSFWYALVFQNPNHTFDEQPFFMFRIKDSLGGIIDSFVRQSSNDASYFNFVGSLRTRNWTEYSVDLSGYLGQTVEIEFTTADCEQTGHYGYAYIDDVCFENCCNTCEDLFRFPGLMANWKILKYSHSTETHCCYEFDWIFDPDIFACDPYGVKIYEEGNENNPYVNYQGSTGMVSGGTIFDASLLDFCISKTDFNGQNKTIRVAFLNKDGEVICDTMKQVLEPCHSSSSGCDCDNLFKNPLFGQASILSNDTPSQLQGQCCFKVNPYTSADMLNCPYYGIRIYKDSSAYNTTFIDTLSSTPMGGPGSTYPDSLNYKFCIGHLFFTNGSMSVRIEYLDSNGKAICSKVEEISCEETCCEKVNYYLRKDTTDPTNCCYRIEIWAFECSDVYTAELVQLTDSGWVSTNTDTLSITRPMFFDVCRPLGDTSKYAVFLRDSAGNVICQKTFETYCKDCCESIDAFMVAVPPPPPYTVFVDKCCWDFYYYPQSFEGCPSPYYWQLFDGTDTVPAQYPWFSIPLGYNLGRYCTPEIYGISPAPGTSVTIWYKIKKQLGIYDEFGNLICVKVMEDSCSRTYSDPGPFGDTTGDPFPFGLVVNPNPFTGVFTTSMELPVETVVSARILNSSGTIVYENNYGLQPAGTFSTTINLGGLPSGSYTLSINNGQASLQIIKQ